VGGGHLRERACRTLSPGELQRVALARALVRVQRGARVLLLDEPTASLDPASTAAVAELLLRLRGSLCTVLVTHEPALAALVDGVVDLPGSTPGLSVPKARMRRSRVGPGVPGWTSRRPPSGLSVPKARRRSREPGG
jgi:ATP-binding cassette subfamily C protein CydCD